MSICFAMDCILIPNQPFIVMIKKSMIKFECSLQLIISIGFLRISFNNNGNMICYTYYSLMQMYTKDHQTERYSVDLGMIELNVA